MLDAFDDYSASQEMKLLMRNKWLWRTENTKVESGSEKAVQIVL